MAFMPARLTPSSAPAEQTNEQANEEKKRRHRLLCTDKRDQNGRMKTAMRVTDVVPHVNRAHALHSLQHPHHLLLYQPHPSLLAPR